jgi:hypothetical protein
MPPRSFRSPLRPDPPDSDHTWYLIPGKIKYGGGYTTTRFLDAFKTKRPEIKLANGSRRVVITRVIDKDGRIWESYEGIV